MEDIKQYSTGGRGWGGQSSTKDRKKAKETSVVTRGVTITIRDTRETNIDRNELSISIIEIKRSASLSLHTDYSPACNQSTL